ncbi:MAG: 5'-nucleotidase C-terminal domain-containing protein [Bradymonadia bacterium]|jgi:2',3'-cyclic-nucleotide 2'-phosphodiesterase (5'-nucleotidase family)
MGKLKHRIHSLFFILSLIIVYVFGLQACEVEPVNSKNIIKLPNAISYDFKIVSIAQWAGQLEAESIDYNIVYKAKSDGEEADYHLAISADKLESIPSDIIITKNADGNITVNYRNEYSYTCHDITEKPTEPLYHCSIPIAGAVAINEWLNDEFSKNDNTIFVSTGDNFGISSQISASFNDVPAIDLLNKLGLQFDTFGNHNLEKGLNYLQNLINISNYSYVVSNLSNVPQNLQHVSPYAFISMPSANAQDNPLPVAIVGTVDHSAASMIFPGSLGTTSIRDYCASKYAMQDAYMQGARAFVLLSHLGIEQNNRDYATIFHFASMLLEMKHGEYNVCAPRRAWSSKYKIDETVVNKHIYNGIIAIIGAGAFSNGAFMINDDNVDTLLSTPLIMQEVLLNEHLNTIATEYQKIVHVPNPADQSQKHDPLVNAVNHSINEKFKALDLHFGHDIELSLCHEKVGDKTINYCSSWDMYPDKESATIRISLDKDESKITYSKFVKELFTLLYQMKYPDNSTNEVAFDEDRFKNLSLNSITQGFDVLLAETKLNNRTCPSEPKAELPQHQQNVCVTKEAQDEGILFVQAQERGIAMLKLDVNMNQVTAGESNYKVGKVIVETKRALHKNDDKIDPAKCSSVLLKSCKAYYELLLHKKEEFNKLTDDEKASKVMACLEDIKNENVANSTYTWRCLYNASISYECEGEGFVEPVIYELEEQLPYSPQTIRRMSTRLGNAVSDAIIGYYNIAHELRIDASLVNGGAIRASLGTSNVDGRLVRASDARKVCLYANYIVVMNMTARELAEVLYYGFKYSQNPESDHGGYLQVGGIRYKYSSTENYKIKQIDLVNYNIVDEKVDKKFIPIYYHLGNESSNNDPITCHSSPAQCNTEDNCYILVQTSDDKYCYLHDPQKGDDEESQLYSVATLDYLYNGGDGFVFPNVAATIYDRYDIALMGFFKGTNPIVDVCNENNKANSMTIDGYSPVHLKDKIRESRACNYSEKCPDNETWNLLEKND